MSTTTRTTTRTQTKGTAMTAKKSTAKPEVDLTRNTPFGTEYRVARAAAFADLDLGDAKWATVCLTHGTFIPSDNLRQACFRGTKGATAEWCKACGKLASAPAPAKASTKPASGTKAKSGRTTRKPAAKPAAEPAPAKTAAQAKRLATQAEKVAARLEAEADKLTDARQKRAAKAKAKDARKIATLRATEAAAFEAAK